MTLTVKVIFSHPPYQLFPSHSLFFYPIPSHQSAEMCI